MNTALEDTPPWVSSADLAKISQRRHLPLLQDISAHTASCMPLRSRYCTVSASCSEAPSIPLSLEAIRSSVSARLDRQHTHSFNVLKLIHSRAYCVVCLETLKSLSNCLFISLCCYNFSVVKMAGKPPSRQEPGAQLRHSERKSHNTQHNIFIHPLRPVHFYRQSQP